MSVVVLCRGKRGETRNVSDGILLLLRIALVLFVRIVLMVWCYFNVLVSFCTWEFPIEISRRVLCEIIHENYLCY